jgi:hypothetical protein
MKLLLRSEIYRKIDNGLLNKDIINNIEKVYSAERIGNIIKTNFKNKSLNKIHNILKKKYIIMDIIRKEKSNKNTLLIIVKESNFKTKFINNINKYKYNINSWYNIIGLDKINSIPCGLMLTISGRMLKLRKASRTKIYKLIIGNIKSNNNDIYYKTIIEKNGSIGIKLKIYDKII